MSVFVIFASYNVPCDSDDKIVGYKLSKNEANDYCDKRNKERENHWLLWNEYNSSIKQYEQATCKTFKTYLIDINEIEKEYLRLRKNSKPDLSKIPQERHKVVMDKWNEKTGNRLAELERIMNMPRKDILIHNDNIHNEVKKLFGEPPVKPSIDIDEQQYHYYYKEIQELP